MALILGAMGDLILFLHRKCTQLTMGQYMGYTEEWNMIQTLLENVDNLLTRGQSGRNVLSLKAPQRVFTYFLWNIWRIKRHKA